MSWSWEKIALVSGVALGGGALAVVTGGLAAPAVGAALGSAMGFSGCVATSAGLAALGGGSLAAGGAGMAGGTAVIAGAAGVAGAGTSAAGAALHAHVKDVEKLNVIARDLRSEVSSLKTKLNDTTRKSAQARAALEQELASKEGRLAAIERQVLA